MYVTTPTVTFQRHVLAVFEDYCRCFSDIDIVFQDALEDVLRQRDLVNTFIAERVDALLVVPVDTSGREPIMQAAGEAGIPLVFC